MHAFIACTSRYIVIVINACIIYICLFSNSYISRHIIRWYFSSLWNQLMPTLYLKESPPFSVNIFKGCQQVVPYAYINFKMRNIMVYL